MQWLFDQSSIDWIVFKDQDRAIRDGLVDGP
jgi:hypothetical protein